LIQFILRNRYSLEWVAKMLSGAYILIINSLIPITMIVLGGYFSKHAPKNINGLYGYRTTMSMRNKETWEFAHNYCGRLWFKLGWILLIISVIPMLFVIMNDKSIISNFGLVLCAIQVVFLISSILPTEIALSNKFDINGNRKI